MALISQTGKDKAVAAGILSGAAGLGTGFAIGSARKVAKAALPNEKLDAILEDVGELKGAFSALADALSQLVSVLTSPPEPSELPPYNVRKFELDTAKTTNEPQEVELPGDTLTFYTDGTFDGIQFALDSPTNDWIAVGEFGNPYSYPAKFQRFYLAWTAQSGKYLRVHVGREAGASATPVVMNVIPGKELLGRGQAAWELLVTRRASDGNAIPGGSSVAVDAYVVPTNYKLHIGGAIVTCNASCIQKIVMAHTPGIIGDYRYDVKGELILSPLSSTIIDSGDTLTIYIYNNDTVARDFSVTVVGVLEAI